METGELGFPTPETKPKSVEDLQQAMDNRKLEEGQDLFVNREGIELENYNENEKKDISLDGIMNIKFSDILRMLNDNTEIIIKSLDESEYTITLSQWEDGYGISEEEYVENEQKSGTASNINIKEFEKQFDRIIEGFGKYQDDVKFEIEIKTIDEKKN